MMTKRPTMDQWAKRQIMLAHKRWSRNEKRLRWRRLWRATEMTLVMLGAAGLEDYGRPRSPGPVAF
jgi:hypothetical protein